MANNDDLEANWKIVPSLLPCGTQLSPEWKAITTTDQRVYFVNRRTRSSHWFPPPEFWVSKLGLPYGWEAALDHQSKKYYINHLTRTTTREDPRSEADQAAHYHMTPPQARRIELIRDAKIGFGFVAGSEKPVVIRSVIPNGPSDEKLFANDQILKVNGQDVRDAAQADVISLIKNAIGSIELEIIASEDVQDSKNQHNRKSSLMSRTTRERRRSTPVSVRFADEPALVQVIGPMEPVRRSSVPLIPNVLKVFLENGQTRSFRYDSNTTAEEIFCSFSSKLDVKLMEHFSLVLTGPKKGQISYIQNNEKIAEIFTNRNCSSVNCLCKLNIAFVPKDHFELLSQDRNTFEYLFAQVTNRVVEGFYGMDLKYDLAIKLAALQIQQKAMEAAAGRPVKISVRQVEKEFGGLAKFVTSDLLHNMREKELRKILDQQIKLNENLASPGEKYMSSLQCKLHYLNLSAEMFSYGGSYFDAELVDNGNEGPSLKKTKKQHITVLINLKYGVSQVVRGKVNVLCQLAEFHEITGFAIRVHEDNKRLLGIKLQEGKKIQLICSTVDCLDMITLITGYYKVYVDNTSNTPLPVENEEKWPFAFRRDPPVNDALPDFYSRHRVVPDVWSYPSCFQTSNAKRKTQVENSKPAPKDVFLDLSRAPPRFNETAISEEPEEHNMVLEETDQNQVDETTLRRESLNREDLSTPNLQYQFDACISEMQQDDLLEIDMSDKDQKLLDTASSLLKNTSEDNVDANDEMQSDAVSVSNADAKNEDLVALDKRQDVFEKENLTRDSVKTTPTEHTHDNQEDFISERILAEEIWQEEEAGTVLGDEREEHIEDASSSSTWATEESDSSAAVEMKSEETCTKVEDSGEPVQLSTKIDHSSQSERTLVENKSLLASLPSGGTVDVNHNLVISPITQTASGTDESECTAPEVFDTDGYPHLGLSVQHDPLIDTGPFQDRSATPSSKDLVWDSNLDNEGNELADSLGHEIAPEGFFERESDAEKPAGLDGIRSDGKGSESPVAFRDSDEFELTSHSGSVRDSIGIDSNPVDLDNSADIVASHMVCLEFDADSDTETESTLSDEDESLWSIFPEYFPPSRRLRYSNNKQAELLLAQEDQDTDGLDCTETDQEVALVGVKELTTAYKSNSQDTVDISDKQDGVSLTDDSEELSTASSESFEYTYEVNAEFPSESEEVSEDSGYVNLTESNERRIQEICNQRKDTNSFSPQDEMVQVARDKCIGDKCDVPLSDPNDKISKVSGTIVFSLDEITSLLDPENASGKKECAEMLKDSLEEHPPRTGLENGSSCSFVDGMSKDAFLEKTRVLSEECRSLNYSDKDKGRILDRDFSPSDWIIPSPPSPTPELLETDLCIVSPPPRSPTLIEDDLDAELKHLIVPPPPPSEDTLPIVSGIRIVSPPPLEVDDNELDHLLYNYDDNKFLSLTVDRKIAKNNVLISTQNFNSNLNEDKKIQPRKVKADASSISNEGVNENKTIGMLSIENSILDSSGNSRNTVQTSVEPSSTTNLFTTRALNSQCSLPNPLTNCSDALDNSPTTLKRFHKEMSDDHLNKDNIRGKSKNPITTAELNSLSNCGRGKVSVENRSRFPLKQKPPVPPKPRTFRAVTDDGMYGSVKSSNVKVHDSADSGVKWAPEICKDSSLSKETSSVKLESLRPTLLGADEQVITRASCGDTSALDSQTAAEDIKSRKEDNLPGEKHGTRRSSSFAGGSPHVPAPYASSSSQSLYSAESSVVSTHRFTPHTASLLLEQVPTVNSSASAGSTLFAKNKERPPLMRNPASHTSLQDSHGDLCSNASGDGISRVLTHPLAESPISQLSAVYQQEDNCNSPLTSPPPPDSPPPPLPESSPPKLIPEFNAGDFDFGESPLEAFQDDSRNKSPESDTFGLPSSAKELKSKRPLTSLDYKQGDSRSNFSERREKPHGVNTLCRSITVTSFPPEITQRSSSEGWTSHRDAGFPNCGTKRSSFPFDEFCNLKDIAATGLSSSLQEHQSLKAKCENVCEEGLSKVIALENRLEMCLNREASKPQFFNEVKNWPLIFQNNARFLACDIKVISSSVRRGSPQVVSAVETSLDALEKLIESCEKTCSMLNENQNGHSLVAMVRDLLERYRDIIFALKIACGQQPDHPDVEVLVKRTNAMATLIASLIRELRNY